MSHKQRGLPLQVQKYFCARPGDDKDLNNRHMQLSNSALRLLVFQLHDNQLGQDIPTFPHNRIRKCQYQSPD